MIFVGSYDMVNRLLCGYNPCYNNKKDSNTSYKQQRRFFFITQNKDLTCPRKNFREDLGAQLKKWRESGDRLIIYLDANEYIYKKRIRKALMDPGGGLAMK